MPFIMTKKNGKRPAPVLARILWVQSDVDNLRRDCDNRYVFVNTTTRRSIKVGGPKMCKVRK